MSEETNINHSADLGEYVADLGKRVKDEFAANQRVLSFAEYLELLEARPDTQLRNSAQYLRDMFLHYGEKSVKRANRSMRRFGLFDAPWAHGDGRLVGQEEVQNRIFRALENFVRQGYVNRCILLHGPNGSSKSTITDVIAAAMEDYSAKDEGALYSFSWVFPTHAVQRSGIGFGDVDQRRISAEGSFAHLDDTAIDARISCDQRDHPLLLVPRRMRRELLARISADGRCPEHFTVSKYIDSGNLCHRCKQIYEALLAAYEGDYARVLRHVQVQRYYVSRRYWAGTARVEPQMAADARTLQITADRSLAALPSALQNINLYSVDGELIRGNRGIVDYADLFKRPFEAFKYMLGAVESGQVALEHVNLFVDSVFVGSANEAHLGGFMETGEWMSFRSRMELVRVPYLRDYRLEEEIYSDGLSGKDVGKPVAPHAVAVAALWAVLTRLREPQSSSYDPSIRDVLEKLTPLDKALLYAEGRVPLGLSEEVSRGLKAATASVHDETKAAVVYEGRTGASPREVRALLLNAAQNTRYSCLTPEAVLEEITNLVEEKSVYEFLRQEKRGVGYFDHGGFVAAVRDWYLAKVDDEARSALGLVEESRYEELFGRYVTHVTHYIRKERLHNEVTGGFDDPSVALMKEVEKTLDVQGDPEEFRQSIMTKIGAWSIDNPDERPDYSLIFAEQFGRMRGRYYEQQYKRVKRRIEQTIALLSNESSGITEADRAEIELMLERMERNAGYCRACAREMLVTLARYRYAE